MSITFLIFNSCPIGEIDVSRKVHWTSMTLFYGSRGKGWRIANGCFVLYNSIHALERTTIVSDKRLEGSTNSTMKGPRFLASFQCLLPLIGNRHHPLLQLDHSPSSFCPLVFFSLIMNFFDCAKVGKRSINAHSPMTLDSFESSMELSLLRTFIVSYFISFNRKKKGGGGG